MISVLHTEGLQFDPGLDHFFSTPARVSLQGTVAFNVVDWTKSSNASFFTLKHGHLISSAVVGRVHRAFFGASYPLAVFSVHFNKHDEDEQDIVDLAFVAYFVFAPRFARFSATKYLQITRATREYPF